MHIIIALKTFKTLNTFSTQNLRIYKFCCTFAAQKWNDEHILIHITRIYPFGDSRTDWLQEILLVLAHHALYSHRRFHRYRNREPTTLWRGHYCTRAHVAGANDEPWSKTGIRNCPRTSWTPYAILDNDAMRPLCLPYGAYWFRIQYTPWLILFGSRRLALTQCDCRVWRTFIHGVCQGATSITRVLPMAQQRTKTNQSGWYTIRLSLEFLGTLPTGDYSPLGRWKWKNGTLGNEYAAMGVQSHPCKGAQRAKSRIYSSLDWHTRTRQRRYLCWYDVAHSSAESICRNSSVQCFSGSKWYKRWYKTTDR